MDHVVELVEQRAQVVDAGDEVGLASDELPVAVTAHMTEDVGGGQSRLAGDGRHDADEFLVAVVAERRVGAGEAGGVQRRVPRVGGQGLVDHVLDHVEQDTLHPDLLGRRGQGPRGRRLARPPPRIGDLEGFLRFPPGRSAAVAAAAAAAVPPGRGAARALCDRARASWPPFSPMVAGGRWPRRSDALVHLCSRVGAFGPRPLSSRPLRRLRGCRPHGRRHRSSGGRRPRRPLRAGPNRGGTRRRPRPAWPGRS